MDIQDHVNALPEVYQPILGHPDLSTSVSRLCEDRFALVDSIYTSLASAVKRPLRVLDLGCAQGYFSLKLSDRGARVVGIDFLKPNIDLCLALARERKDDSVIFSHARAEEFIETIDDCQFDLVLGLSVFHHIAYHHGFERVKSLINTLRQRTNAGVFELALPEEAQLWSSSLKSPSDILADYAFAFRVGLFPTHLSSIRPVYFASDKFWYLGGNIAKFDYSTSISNPAEPDAHEGTRKFYFSRDLMLKLYRRENTRSAINEKEWAQEVRFLKSGYPTLTGVRLHEFGGNTDALWIVRDLIQGVPLHQLDRESSDAYDPRLVVTSLLRQLASLEDVELYHSDLRTWNVLICGPDAGTLIDFGAISGRSEDISWPYNLFVSFLILVRNIIAGTCETSRYRSLALDHETWPTWYRRLWTIITGEPSCNWSFAKLLATITEDDSGFCYPSCAHGDFARVLIKAHELDIAEKEQLVTWGKSLEKAIEKKDLSLIKSYKACEERDHALNGLKGECKLLIDELLAHTRIIARSELETIRTKILSEQLIQANQRLIESDESINNLRAEQVKLQSRATDFENQIGEKNVELAGLKNSLAESHQLVNSLQLELQENTQKFAELENWAKSLEERLKTREHSPRRSLSFRFRRSFAKRFGKLAIIFAKSPRNQKAEGRVQRRWRRLKRSIQKRIPKRSNSRSAFHAPEEHLLALDTTDTQLAFRRIAALQSTLASSAGSAGFPKLAYVSPLPPAQTGIAQYSVDLIGALAKFYRIDVFVPQDPSAVEKIAGCTAVRPLADLAKEAGSYDRILYHIGNSTFHHEMFDYVERFPGVVVLHDVYLGHLLAYLEREGGWGRIWTQSLYSAHGYNAAKLPSMEQDVESAILSHPSSYFIMRHAAGVLFHSRFALDLAKSFYPRADHRNWSIVPFARGDDVSESRDLARSNLGIEDDEFVVCSFGFLGPTKLNHKIVEAWLASAALSRNRCRLIFVGELPNGQYGANLTKIIGTHPNVSITITGFTQRDQYRRYLASADACVQLRQDSRGETSAAALDGLRCGIPLIVNKHGSLAELPDDVAIKIPDRFDTGELVSALERLLTDPVLRAKMSARAKRFGVEFLSPERAAVAYRDAIEAFSRAAPLISNAVALKGFVRSNAFGQTGFVDAAKTISKLSPTKHPQRQFLFDVSALVRCDLKTGIQRVVREQLKVLLAMRGSAFRVEPVWLDNSDGEWKLRYARKFTSEMLGIPKEGMCDQLVSVGPQDVYFGGDFFTEGTIQASNQGLFAQMRVQGVQIAYSVYDLLPVQYPEFFPPGMARVHCDWLHAISSHADKLVCISQSVADDFRRWAADQGNKMPMLYTNSLGANFSAVQCKESPTVDFKSTIQSSPIFLMVGTIEPRKGYLQVLRAFDELWGEGIQVNLVIVGAEGWKGLPNESRRTIPEIVRVLRCHKERNRKLFWIEDAGDQELEDLYRNADCLLAASEGEGFGLPLIEAARVGVPILARDIPVFRETVGGSAAFFRGLSGVDLATAIRDWLSSPEKLGPSLHPSAARTWEQNAETLVSQLLGIDTKEQKKAEERA